MKKIWIFIAILAFAAIIPLQASAASLSEVRSYVHNNYYGEINGDIYDAQTIDELMDMLDPYSVYFTKEQYRAFFQSIENETVGIGVVIEQHEKGIYISEVINNGPAFSAGLKVGDIITHADGVPLVGLSLSNAASHITGDENTTVTLQILRADGSTNTLSIVRKVVQTPNIVSALLYGNVGYIYLASYSENAAKEISNAIGSLKKQGATHFIFDIQNNGGGYVSTAVDTISLFPKAINAFQQLDATGTEMISIRDNMSPSARLFNKFTTNTSLLINGYSASASDMTAGAVKDQHLATIYGSTSYGKGLMQTFQTFSDGSAVKLTIAEFRTPNGSVINHVGIKPDIETTTPIADAHRDAITAQLTNYKKLTTLSNVAIDKSFTLSLSSNVENEIATNAIEVVKLGGSKIDITTKVENQKIIVTPKELLEPGAHYLLIAHPQLKSKNGKLLKTGTYIEFTVKK